MRKDKAPTEKVQVPVSVITTHWRCKKCKQQYDVPVTDLLEIGTPICGDCDEECSILPKATVSTKPRL